MPMPIHLINQFSHSSIAIATSSSEYRQLEDDRIVQPKLLNFSFAVNGIGSEARFFLMIFFVNLSASPKASIAQFSG